MPSQESKNALEQLLEMLNLQGRPVELHLDHQAPLEQDPLGPPHAMKPMSPEGEDLMRLLQHYGSDLGPEDLHEDTEGVINRLPGDRMLGGDIIT